MNHAHHSSCAHVLAFCARCDVPYCSKCNFEWAKPCTLQHYWYTYQSYPTRIPNAISSYPATDTNPPLVANDVQGLVVNHGAHQ